MRFLYNAPAIFHKGAIIVGDTHFGMEEKLRRRGIFDDGFSFRLFERLKELVRMHKAKKVIFLGDVKEDIKMLDRKTEEILSRLAMACQIIIVKGNHDGGIEHCGNAKVVGPEGFAYEKLGLLHGHSWPGEELLMCDHLVMGHQHPMISMTDAFGKRHTEPAWIIAPCDEDALSARYAHYNKKIRLILMPAFNPLVGSAINYVENRHLGPVLNNNLFKLNRALVFRLEGTSLGRLENII